MRKVAESPEQIWEELLSRQPGLIKAAFASLEPTDQKAVLSHLQHMVNENGWQPEQRISARAALDVLLSQSE
jgi:hypothetical protein